MLPLSLIIALSVLFGLCIGSFLNVAIYRIPKKESLWWPPSHCACGTLIPWYYNIPVISWLFLRGKSACCQQPIAARYPMVETITGALFGIMAYRFYPVMGQMILFQLFCAAALTAFFIDLDHLEIPDRITLGGSLIAGVIVWLAPEWLLTTRVDAMWGFLLGTSVVAWANFLSFLFLKREGMGWGDAKLLALIGLLMGWQGVVFSFFGGAILGTSFLFLRAFILRQPIKKGREVPFGPMILSGTLGYILGGWALVQWYLGTF